MQVSSLSPAAMLALSAPLMSGVVYVPKYKQCYPLPKAPYGIAKSRRAAKKRNNIRKHK